MALDREEISERVLDIAQRLLEEGGAENLKARTIAQEAGIAVGSIYNMFTDLTGVHRAVNMRLLDELGQRGDTAMAAMQATGETDVRRRLLALAQAYHAFVLDHPGAWAALLGYNRGRIQDRAPDDYVRRLETLFAIIAHVIGSGFPQLQPDETRRIARTLWSSVHGIITSGYATDTGLSKSQQIADQVDLLVTVFIEGLRHHRNKEGAQR